MADELRLEDIKARVIDAVIELYRHEGDLLQRDANERSITHKLAEHMQQLFPGWHVDCEYNRRGDQPKRLRVDFGILNPADTVARTVYPDIVVHRRGTADNLLVVEFKKAGNDDTTNDRLKLEVFTSDEGYAYVCGLMLALGPQGCVRALLFQHGEERADWTREMHARLQERRHVW